MEKQNLHSISEEQLHMFEDFEENLTARQFLEKNVFPTLEKSIQHVSSTYFYYSFSQK